MTKNPQWVQEGARVQADREALGLSRSQLAARIGLSAVSVRNAENGLQRLGRDAIEKLAALVQQHTSGSGRPPTPAPISSPAPRRAPATDDVVELERAFAAAADPTVVRAVAALVDATGMPRERALAYVVRNRLRQD